LEHLEPRAVPTIVFPYQNGAEAVINNGPSRLANLDVQPVFWGTYWDSAQGKNEVTQDSQLIEQVTSTPYFTGLSEYMGGTIPQFHACMLPATDDTSDPYAGQYNLDVLSYNCQLQISHEMLLGAVPTPNAYAPTVVLYAVITPPTTSCVDDQGKGAAGFNEHFSSGQSFVWLSDQSAGQFSQTVGHELAEVMTDPNQGNGINVASGVNFPQPGIGQICDFEAGNYVFLLDGVWVQSFWSAADKAYIIPDGNSLQFELNGTTLVINGGQLGTGVRDSVVLSQAGSSVNVTLDGQTDVFPSSLVKEIDLDNFSGMSVNLDGSWIGGPTLKVNVNTTPAAINICGDGNNMGQNVWYQALQVNDPYGYSTLNLDDTADTSGLSWILNASDVNVNGMHPVTYTTGHPGTMNLNAGTGGGDYVALQATQETVNLNFHGPGCTVTAGAGNQSLTYFGGIVTLNGPVKTLTLADQADPDPNVTVVVDHGEAYRTNMIPIHFTTLYNLVYDAGSGTDTFEVAPQCRNLDMLPGNVTFVPGSGAESLVVNDSGHATEIYPNGYIVSPYQIMRASLIYSTSPSGGCTVNYANLNGPVTLDTDSLGSAVDIEGVAAATPITVNLGSVATAVTLGAQNQTLAAFAGGLTINEGFAQNTLTIDDQKDSSAGPMPYLLTAGAIARTFTSSPFAKTIHFSQFNGGVTLNTDNNGTAVDVESIGTPTTLNLGSGNTTVTVGQQSQSLAGVTFNAFVKLPLAVNGGPGADALVLNDSANPSTAGTAYTVSATSIIRNNHIVGDGLPMKAEIDYKSLSAGVTLNTDNNGTSVNVDAISDPVTINVGTGNTPVSVGQTNQTLDPFLWVAYTLTLNGGPGSDALTFYDQADPWTGPGAGYTLTAGQLTRKLSSYIATIPYRSFSAGVTLDSDNHGTPVSVESTAVPTTVNLGTGNTAVSVAPVGQNLAQVASGLTVAGVLSANDSLTVYDTHDPLTSGRVGLRFTSYSYTITGQAIARTTSVQALGQIHPTLSHINVNDSGMTSVVLDTDNNGTPIDVESTSAPTTVNLGSGNTSAFVTQTNQDLADVSSGLTINGGTGLDNLTINDAQYPALGSGWSSGYTLSGQGLSRTDSTYTPLHMWRTLSIGYSNLRGGVTFDTDNHGTPVMVTGTGGIPMTINGGAGMNTIEGDNTLPNTWSLIGLNSGTVNGWFAFNNMENVLGGLAGNSFDFSPGGSIGGALNGVGPSWLNYARETAMIAVNLAAGTATGVAGPVTNVQGVVGSPTGSTLTGGSGRSILIGGGGPAQLAGGSSDSLLIGGGTTYDLNDAALLAILAEWDTNQTFAARIAQLTSGVGPNGSYALNASTITEDSQANTLITGSGPTWFLAHQKDTVKSKAGDVVNLFA
jgi:hypothetical protein